MLLLSQIIAETDLGSRKKAAWPPFFWIKDYISSFLLSITSSVIPSNKYGRSLCILEEQQLYKGITGDCLEMFSQLKSPKFQPFYKTHDWNLMLSHSVLDIA